MATNYIGGERRSHRRYAVQLDLRYQIVGEDRIGEGKTRDLSSRGVACITHPPLPVGRIVELTILWPASLEGSVPLNLVVGGMVVRSGSEAAVEIMHHEFRTRGTRRVRRADVNFARPEIPEPAETVQ